MKIWLSYIIAFFALHLVAQKHYVLHPSLTSKDYLANTIILKVKPNYRNHCTSNAINHPLFQNLVQSLNVTNLHKKFPFDKAPERESNSAGQRFVDLSLIYELNYNSSLPIEKAINKLLSTGVFIYAEPHIIPQLNYNPNDPLANPTDQYHLQTINAFNAWNINKGDSTIVIGITDTGIDPTHPDLFNCIKRNYNDIPDGVDNDGDLYVDNYLGWDLGSNDNDATFAANAHGVHVCGIAGATTDNATGGAGIGFNCKILPIKISDATGSLIAAYEGIKYGADHGCTVINCSWGSTGSSQYGQDIIDYATINKNCLIVAAAGNNIFNTDFYPAAYNHVLAVANTNSSDVKSNSSNYGYFVDVCAPGENIFSTWPGNMYVNQSGTSMASPLTAGAAGLVKKQFPSYNALQIGERLKVTADNIYSLNTPYVNRLGSGRINVFRALSDPPTPGVVFSNKAVSDHNDEMFIIGDTLFITGLFTNYLDPTSALSATLNPLSAYAAVIDNTTSLGIINTLASANNNTDPFRYKLNGSIPINQAIDFELVMQDGSYQSKQFFTVYVNVDYINITINDVNTTATSNGKIGYNQNGQSQGLGFAYKGVDLLYEAGLMVGVDTNRVSDCVRGNNPSIADVDFSNQQTIAKQIPSIYADLETQAKIKDNLAFTPLNIEVGQKTLTWVSAPNRQFVIWEYQITNKNSNDTLKNLYIGLFADWDIDGATYAQNRSGYHPATKMGYSFYTASNGKYGGIKLLTNTAAPNFYAVDHVSGGNGGLDFTNGVDTKEKYVSLSTQRLSAGAGGNGNDVINVMSSGPFTLKPNESVTVAFAVLGADSLAHLINGANQAQLKYDGLTTGLIPFSTIQNNIYSSPNPANDIITIQQNNIVYNQVEIINVSGQIIAYKKLTSANEIINVSDFPNGFYFLRYNGGDQSFTQKLIISH